MKEIKDPHDIPKRQGHFRKLENDETFLFEFNQYLQFLKVGTNSVNNCKYPIIYVVGLPRSGTTLLSQLISRCFQVGYINNLIARFWLNPVVGIRLSQMLFGPDIRGKINLDSEHGVSLEPWGPHEFGYFWRHWLLLDESPTHKLSDGLCQKIDAKGLRIMLGNIVSEFGMPVVFKNIICGLQASLLTEIYTNSLFVFIERDPKKVALSILRCRTERYGDAKTWWSIKPSTFNKISQMSDPHAQIERQIADTDREFQEELSKPGVNCVKISYEDLCDNAPLALRKISDALALFSQHLTQIESPPILDKRV